MTGTRPRDILPDGWPSDRFSYRGFSYRGLCCAKLNSATWVQLYRRHSRVSLTRFDKGYLRTSSAMGN